MTTTSLPSTDALTPVAPADSPPTQRGDMATQAAADLDNQLTLLRQQLADARTTIVALERRQKIDALLAEQETVDMEVARLLTEAAVSRMSAPDVKLAIDDLRRHKPYLFRHRGAGRAGVMGARVATPALSRDEAAQRAAVSGDRRDLLSYLRLRRTKA